MPAQQLIANQKLHVLQTGSVLLRIETRRITGVTRVSLDMTVAKLRDRLRMKFPGKTAHHNIWHRGKQLSLHQTLRDCDLRPSGDILYYRADPPPFVVEADVVEWHPMRDFPDAVSENMHLLLSELNISTAEARKRPTRLVLYNVMQSFVEFHDGPKMQVSLTKEPPPQLPSWIKTEMPYKKLVNRSKRPPGLDSRRLEMYLSDRNFEKVFGMEKEEFEALPFWWQWTIKIKLKLAY
jgi:Villin headpiece domain